MRKLIEQYMEAIFTASTSEEQDRIMNRAANDESLDHDEYEIIYWAYADAKGV